MTPSEHNERERERERTDTPPATTDLKMVRKVRLGGLATSLRCLESSAEVWPLFSGVIQVSSQSEGL